MDHEAVFQCLRGCRRHLGHEIMQHGFDSAFYSGKHKCLGVHLEPLTIGHLFALHEQRSPFVQPSDAGVTDGDLLEAVFLCSQPWERSRRDSRKWWVRPLLTAWIYFTRKLDFDAEVKAFCSYLEDNLPVFEQWLDGESSFGSSPLPVFLLSLAMNRLHIPINDAMNMRTSLLICLVTSLSEHEGKIRLVSEDHLEFRKWAKEQYAARAKN